MHDQPPDDPDLDCGHAPGSGPRRRWLALGVLSVAALLLHAAAFSGLEWSWPQAERPVPPGASVRVRVVEPAIAPVPVALRPAPTADAAAAPPAALAVVVAAGPRLAGPAPAPARARPAAVREKAVAEAAPVRASLPPVAAAPVAPPLVAVAAEPPVAVQLALNTTPAAEAPTATTDEDTIPHYRSKMPPALTLRYEMQKGALQGTGDLFWRPQGERYELKLEARVSGLAVLTQVSSGGFDAAGLAPQRFTDKRLARSMTAANFQRTADKITYSGASETFALRAGAQDRLSWMIQLAAIVAGEPQLAKAGAKVVMFVTGSHGDAGVWSFKCFGLEAVSTRNGSLDAIKFVREPRDAHDTTVQVWLAPQQHDLPVRATQKSGPNDDGYELRLLEVVPAP